MLYVALNRHKGQGCPCENPELMKIMAATLSKSNLSKKGVKIIEGFLDRYCMLANGKEHLCLFIIESDLQPLAVSDIFKPMVFEVNPITRWQGPESKIKQAKMA